MLCCIMIDCHAALHGAECIKARAWHGNGPDRSGKIPKSEPHRELLSR